MALETRAEVRLNRLVAVALAAALPACATDMAAGTVRAVYPGEAAILIAHGAIKRLAMEPMTMEFVLADPALAKDLKAGDRVVFTAVKRGDDYVITSIRKKRD